MNDSVLFLAKIQQVLSLLNEIDDVIENNPDMQRNIDWEISDYLHILENNELSVEARLELDDRLKTCRRVRRQTNTIQAISKVFNDNRGKIIWKNQRDILYSMMATKVSELNNEYKYRVLDEDTVNNFLTTKSIVEETREKVKKTRGKDACITKEELEEKINSGMRNKEIAEEIGVTPEYVSALKRKLGIKRRTYERRV